MLIQHIPVCLGWNEERALLPSSTEEKTQAGLQLFRAQASKEVLSEGMGLVSSQVSAAGQRTPRVQLCSLCMGVLSQDP